MSAQDDALKRLKQAVADLRWVIDPGVVDTVPTMTPKEVIVSKLTTGDLPVKQVEEIQRLAREIYKQAGRLGDVGGDRELLDAVVKRVEGTR